MKEYVKPEHHSKSKRYTEFNDILNSGEEQYLVEVEKQYDGIEFRAIDNSAAIKNSNYEAITIKSPKPDAKDFQEKSELIRAIYRDLVHTTKHGTYEELYEKLDMDSFAEYVMIHQYSRTLEQFYYSVLFFVYPNDPYEPLCIDNYRIKFSSIWEFDLVYGMTFVEPDDFQDDFIIMIVSENDDIISGVPKCIYTLSAIDNRDTWTHGECKKVSHDLFCHFTRK